MDYCLVEKWIAEITLPEKSTAVALTEEAIFQLEDCGIPYITLEELYTSWEIRGDVDEFLIKQLSWFDEFDRLLKETFPEAENMGVNLATIYFYPIRRVVGNSILTTRILRKFIESVKPGKIWYIGPEYSIEGINRFSTNDDFEEHLLDPDFKTGENPYSLLIEPICNTYDIKFQRIEFCSRKIPKKKASTSKKSKIGFDKSRIKHLLKKYLPASYLKSLFIYLKSMKNVKKKGRILILEVPGTMNEFCIDSRKYGFDLFIRNNEDIQQLSWKPWPRRMKIAELRMKENCPKEDVLNKILDGELMNWINSQCGMDVSGILYARFRYFLLKTCPEVLSKIRGYIEFYEKNRIDFVVAPNLWTTDDHAAIAAARLTTSTKSIGFSHGSDVYDCKSRFFFMDRHFDIFFNLSEQEAEHERQLARRFNYTYPDIYESPYFCRRVTKNITVKNNNKSDNFAGNRRVVLFLPIIYGSRPGRGIELNQPFPMEYVKWHRALADYFSSRKDILFIWKGLIQSEQKFDLMAEIIRAKKYENIKFDSSSLYRWLPFVDRVLCDIPSTAFFECLYSDMPVLALHRPKYQVLRENAHDSFGSSLRAYNCIEEGLGVVSEFLDAKREEYIVPFSEPDIFVPEVLGTQLCSSEKDKYGNRNILNKKKPQYTIRGN